MTETERVSELLQGFFKDMNRWEVFFWNTLKRNSEDQEHFKQTFKDAKEKLEVIYSKYLTQRDRKYTTRNSLGSDPAYDTKKEKIVSILQKSKRRIEIETIKEDTIQLKNQYVFLIEDSLWKLDNKKTFWKFKNKWESTVI